MVPLRSLPGVRQHWPRVPGVVAAAAVRQKVHHRRDVRHQRGWCGFTSDNLRIAPLSVCYLVAMQNRFFLFCKIWDTPGFVFWMPPSLLFFKWSGEHLARCFFGTLHQFLCWRFLLVFVFWISLEFWCMKFSVFKFGKLEKKSKIWCD